MVLNGGVLVSSDEAGEFAVISGGPDAPGGAKLVQLKTVTVREARDPPGHVGMEEEVFATWVATSLILAVMGTQFTSRAGIADRVRVPLDVLTMSVAAFVLLWAALGHFHLISMRARKIALVVAVLAIFLLYTVLVFLVLRKRV